MATITEWITKYDGECDDGPVQLGEPVQVEHPCDPDPFDVTDGITTVDIAVNTISNGEGWNPSSSEFDAGRTWYSGSYTDPYTGVMTERTFHLSGFSADDERAVWVRITTST